MCAGVRFRIHIPADKRNSFLDNAVISDYKKRFLEGGGQLWHPKDF
jgi:hypothetical protein